MGHWIVCPCNGIGNPLSTVSRFAAFRAAELLTQRGAAVEMMAIGRLLARLAPDVEKIRQHPVAIVEGCSHRCASKLLAELGVKPAAYVYIPEVMQAVGLGRRGLDRKYLGPKGRAIVEAVARAVADAVAPQAGSEAAQTEPGPSQTCCEGDEPR